MKKRWMSFVLVLLLLAAVIAGCDPTTVPQVVEKVVTTEVERIVTQEVEKTVIQTVEVEKEVVKVATPTLPPDFGLTEKIVVGKAVDFYYMDPQKNSYSSDGGLHLSLFNSLVRRADDMSIVPLLAESWEMETPSQWIFHLRKGVKFHNGEPFNAEVVKWNVERVLVPDWQDWAFLSFLDSAEVIDEYTVRILTAAPSPTFLARMTMFFMVPPGYVQEVGDEGFAKAPIGTGAFKFAEYVKDDHLTMEANPDYWGEQPKVKTVVWRIIPEASTRLAALTAGEVDVIESLPPDQIPAVAANPDLFVANVPSLRTPFVRLFPDSPQGGGEPLKDPRVRQALNYAVNVDAIIEYLLLGQAQRTATLMTPVYWGYDASINAYPYDPEKAKQLLAEAGYPQGISFNFEVSPGELMAKPMEVGEAIVSDWAKVGINAQLVSIEAVASEQAQHNRTLAPVHMWSWGGTQMDGDDKFWGVFHEDSSSCFLTMPEVVELINAERQEFDETVRMEQLSTLQHLVYDNALIVPLYANFNIYAASTKLMGWTPRADERINLEQAWLKE